ncbi:MAG: RIBULOSE-phosphate 3-epimerase [Caeruleum heppii]|nr:MAG: RIBULOSE-phosphate 3-epimerase [Caeruleum heppii]
MMIGQVITGRTGQRYSIEKILQERRNNDCKVFLATSNGESFVVKTVLPRQFQKANIMKEALPRTTMVRMPVDEIENHNALVYEYATEDLQKLAKRVTFNRSQIKKISRDVLQAIADMHEVDWMHGDIKSGNVLIDYTTTINGNVDIKRVYLIDIENALSVKDDHYMFDVDVGHPFWRSPEAHARRMIGKPADIFSFGLIVVHLLLGGEHYILDPGPPTEEVDPAVAGLERISHYFGEYPEDFAKRLDDGLPENEQIWHPLLSFLNSELKKQGQYAPFCSWESTQVAKEDSAFVWSFMSKLDPLDRISAKELLKDPWFNT